MFQSIFKTRSALLVFSFGLAMTSFAKTASAGVCAKDDFDMMKAAGFEISPYANCIDEKVPGLVHDEVVLSVVDPKAFSEVQHFVINRNSGDVTRIPYVFHRNKNSSQIMEEIIATYLQQNGGMEGQKSSRTSLKCLANLDNNSARISLSRRPTGYEWEYHILRPTTCDVREDFKAKATTRIGFVGLKQTVITRQLNGEFNFDNAPIEYIPRQSFTRFSGGNSDIEAKMIAKPFFPRCRVKRDFSIKGAVTTVYNMNSPGLLTTDRAIVVNKTGTLPAEVITTPGENQKGTPIFLERRGITGQIELAGAFKVADLRELDNLIVSGYPQDEVRVTIRDLECGRNISTNWIPMDMEQKNSPAGTFVTGSL